MSKKGVDNKPSRKVRAFLLRFVLPFAVIIAAWQIAAYVVDKDFLIPYPLTVLCRLGELALIPSFWLSILATLGRVVLGFLLGFVAGTLIASAMYANRFVEYLFSPIMKILKTTPIVSFILILLLWIDSSFLPTVVSAIMVTPVVWANVFSGLRDVKKEHLEMARVYHLSFLVRLKSIYAPSLKGHFLAASLAGVGLAWKSGVTAEVLALPALAIGHKLYNAKIYLESPDIFAWTIVIIIVSVLFEYLVIALSQKALGGEERDRV